MSFDLEYYEIIGSFLQGLQCFSGAINEICAIKVRWWAYIIFSRAIRKTKTIYVSVDRKKNLVSIRCCYYYDYCFCWGCYYLNVFFWVLFSQNRLNFFVSLKYIFQRSSTIFQIAAILYHKILLFTASIEMKCNLSPCPGKHHDSL